MSWLVDVYITRWPVKFLKVRTYHIQIDYIFAEEKSILFKQETCKTWQIHGKHPKIMLWGQGMVCFFVSCVLAERHSQLTPPAWTWKMATSIVFRCSCDHGPLGCNMVIMAIAASYSSLYMYVQYIYTRYMFDQFCHNCCRCSAWGWLVEIWMERPSAELIWGSALGICCSCFVLDTQSLCFSFHMIGHWSRDSGEKSWRL